MQIGGENKKMSSVTIATIPRPKSLIVKSIKKHLSSATRESRNFSRNTRRSSREEQQAGRKEGRKDIGAGARRVLNWYSTQVSLVCVWCELGGAEAKGCVTENSASRTQPPPPRRPNRSVIKHALPLRPLLFSLTANVTPKHEYYTNARKRLQITRSWHRSWDGQI